MSQNSLFIFLLVIFSFTLTSSTLRGEFPIADGAITTGFPALVQSQPVKLDVGQLGGTPRYLYGIDPNEPIQVQVQSTRGAD